MVGWISGKAIRYEIVQDPAVIVDECVNAPIVGEKAPRIHGGNLREAAQRFDLREKDLVDFSSNVNPLGPSRAARSAVKRCLDRLDRYPDPDAEELRKAIARYFGIRTGQVLCGGGSNGLIHLIPRAFRPRRVLIPRPTFTEYGAAVEDSGGEVVPLLLTEKTGFRIDPVEMAFALKGMDMAFLCNPNNPTGGLVTRGDMLEIAGYAAREGVLLVVDEAFMDFEERESVLKEITGFPNVICLRAFTKFFGLPGLRVGYAVAEDQLIAGLRRHQEPWTVSVPAEGAAIAALGDWGHIRKTRELVETEREWLRDQLRLLPGIEPFPAAANFILFKMVKGEPAALVKRLGEQGFLVRDCSSFPGLNERFIRIAVRTRRENKGLIKAMRKVLLAP